MARESVSLIQGDRAIRYRATDSMGKFTLIWSDPYQLLLVELNKKDAEECCQGLRWEVQILRTRQKSHKREIGNLICISIVLAIALVILLLIFYFPGILDLMFPRY